ncbi:hypothetical protein PIB30_026370 [Stylosanthes scabra]|uniref:Uncharacterized protein n=1 Tax=Stylosanthes scabra TaxID=79078 RepID=A0ABU6QA08_9FABA|nr:hypothetical protein [Stylosanthes scabra]
MGRRGVKEEVAPAEEAIAVAVIRGPTGQDYREVNRERKQRRERESCEGRKEKMKLSVRRCTMSSPLKSCPTAAATEAHRERHWNCRCRYESHCAFHWRCYRSRPNHHLTLLYNMFSFASSTHDPSLILVLFSLAAYLI